MIGAAISMLLLVNSFNAISRLCPDLNIYWRGCL